jgi:hypothetical protein
MLVSLCWYIALRLERKVVRFAAGVYLFPYLHCFSKRNAIYSTSTIKTETLCTSETSTKSPETTRCSCQRTELPVIIDHNESLESFKITESWSKQPVFRCDSRVPWEPQTRPQPYGAVTSSRTHSGIRHQSPLKTLITPPSCNNG